MLRPVKPMCCYAAIGFFAPSVNSPYIRYNIGSSGSSFDVLSHVKEVLFSEVLPFFELLEEPAALGKALAQREFPCLTNEAIEHYIGVTGIQAGEAFT